MSGKERSTEGVKTPGKAESQADHVMALIYGIRPIANQDYFYVGSTVKEATERFNRHIADVKNERHCNVRFAKQVIKLGYDACTVDVLDSVSEEGRFDREYEWIKKFKAQGYALTNIIHSDEQLQHVLAQEKEESLRERVQQQWMRIIFSIIDRRAELAKLPGAEEILEKYQLITPAQKIIWDFAKDMVRDGHWVFTPERLHILRWYAEYSGVGEEFGVQNA